MNRGLPLLLLGAVLGGAAPLPPAAAAEVSSVPVSKPAVRKAILETIAAQLAAFRAGAPAQAFALAAAPLQARLTVEQFAQLVHQVYPEIWDNTRAEFGLVRDDGARAWLEVRVFPKGGDSVVYDYELLKEDAGWRIGGVLRKPDKAQDHA